MVQAKCGDCGDVHGLGDRSTYGESELTTCTTQCPGCGSPSYRTMGPKETDNRSDREKLREVLDQIDGLWDEGRRSIMRNYSYYGLRAADASELNELDGVGSTVAQRIEDQFTSGKTPSSSDGPESFDEVFEQVNGMWDKGKESIQENYESPQELGKASTEELDELDGIGSTVAERITDVV